MRNPTRRIAALMVGGLLLALIPTCGGGDGDGSPVGTTGLDCGDQVTGSIKGTGAVTPNFSNRSSIAFYWIDPLPEDAAAITLTLTSNAGDANLHLAAPGVSPGSANPAHYIISSQASPPVVVDRLRISLIGVEGIGFSLPSPTLADYRDAGRGISFAVWGVAIGNEYDLDITCASSLTIPCGLDVRATLPGSGMAPPDFAGGAEIHFFQVQGLPIAPGSVSILATSIVGDANLYLGRAGMVAPSGDLADWVFSSTAPSAASINDLMILDDTGLHDVFGSTNPTITLQDYVFSGGTLWFAVAGMAPVNDYFVRVTCSVVDPIECGDSRNGSVNGSSQSPPDFGNPLETRFYQLDPLPSSATSVTVTVLSFGGADADLHLAGPGAVPGSEDGADYIFSSEERAPSNRDEITIDMTGLLDGSGGSSTAATLADYLQAATPLSFAVAGYDPVTSFTIDVTCVAPPVVFPIDCGQTIAGAVGGSGQFPPDLGDLGENVWYELTAIPPGVSLLEISLEILGGNADLYLAAPDVPPGSQFIGSYPVSSNASFSDDYIIVWSDGVATVFQCQGSPTISDYINASENPSFVVAGVNDFTTFELTVSCGVSPPNPVRPTDCGGTATDTVQGGSSFADPTVSHIYEIPLASVQGASSIRIEADVGFADADIYLASPGVVPGSVCAPDYPYYTWSIQNPDWIQIDGTGFSAADGTFDPSVTIADYQAASTNLSFVVQGWIPTNYTMRVICN